MHMCVADPGSPWIWDQWIRMTCNLCLLPQIHCFTFMQFTMSQDWQCICGRLWHAEMSSTIPKHLINNLMHSSSKSCISSTGSAILFLPVVLFYFAITAIYLNPSPVSQTACLYQVLSMRGEVWVKPVKTLKTDFEQSIWPWLMLMLQSGSPTVSVLCDDDVPKPVTVL